MLRAHHSSDVAKVAADIFAHYYITGRNALAVKLIVSLAGQPSFQDTHAFRTHLLSGHLITWDKFLIGGSQVGGDVQHE